MKNIPLFRPQIDPRVLDDLSKIFKSGWIGLGPKVEEFEAAFCKEVGCKYALALNSGTSALHLALILYGISKGEKVITTPLTFISTNAAILYQGAIPWFVDIDPETLNITPESIRSSIEGLISMDETPAAIMAVHYGGNPCEINPIEWIAEEYGLGLIWDCAHAMGSKYMGHFVGARSIGIHCFSFHAVKNLGIGDGGMLVVPNKEMYERAKRLRWLGVDQSTYERTNSKGYKWLYSISELGHKYHMNDISAVIALRQLENLKEENDSRKLSVACYRVFLDKLVSQGKIKIIGSNNSNGISSSSNHLFAIKLLQDNRDDLHEYLKEQGITTGVHYYLNHLYDFMPCKFHLLIAEKVWLQILSLPMYPAMTVENVEYVCKNIEGYFGTI